MRNRQDRPCVRLPGEGQEIGAAAEELGDLLRAQRTHFIQGDAVVRLQIGQNGRPRITAVKAVELASDFEEVARFQTSKSQPDVYTNCTEGVASLILNSAKFKAALPYLDRITPSPILVERDAAAAVICGYDEPSGVYACGAAPADVPVDEAVELLRSLLGDYAFATAGDRSRAVAALLTPALVAGGWLGGRAPIDLGEADKSQTGKGYRNKVTAALYNNGVIIVNQRRGIGGLEDSFAKAAMNGSQFIGIDNVRGNIDLQSLESFMTEEEVMQRAAYCPETPVDTRYINVMLTSNSAQMTEDLANRCSCVALRKQAPGHIFAKYPEGDLLTHVRANQSRYLGAVFAVIREWHRRGKPKTAESRHDFRHWCQALDWIVQQLFGEAPLMDGHREAQQRMATPQLQWVRELMLAVVEEHRTDERLTPSDFLDLMVQRGMEIPGQGVVDHLDEKCRTAALTAIGKKLATVLKDSDELAIEGLNLIREHYQDSESRDRKRYIVSSASGIPDGRSAEIVVDLDPWEDDPPRSPPDHPQTSPVIKTLVSLDPRDTSQSPSVKDSHELPPGRQKMTTIAGTSGDQGDQREEYSL
ncbi:hypothetical protein [Lacipirellula sp.]|uniref:hypothetical protein n=1 Tax=Lacipirellula sp. TaxID=2691419 RepID=UPI003D0DCC56